jgi:hypothetical protein
VVEVDTSSDCQVAWAFGSAAVVVAAVRGESFGTSSLLVHGVPLCPVFRGVSASWPFSSPARGSHVCENELVIFDKSAFNRTDLCSFISFHSLKAPLIPKAAIPTAAAS